MNLQNTSSIQKNPKNEKELIIFIDFIRLYIFSNLDIQEFLKRAEI
ncbi:hypothetical protein pb186bvf_015842 [Paramecium bursaria]